MNHVDGHTVMGNGRPSTVPPSAQINPASKLKKAAECPSLDCRNWLIHLHYVRKEFRVCKILIDEELQKSSGKCEYANYVQGILLRHEGKIQESLEYFQISHSLNPRNVDNIKQVARSLYLLGKHRLSMEAYLEAERTSDEAIWDIYYNLGMCCLHLGDNRNAKDYLCKSLQLSRQECSYVSLAKIHLRENDVNGAIQIYNDALELYPDSSDIATSLGLLYMKEGHYQEAFEKLGSALVHDPTCTKALLSVGSMMQEHQDFDVALSKYKIVSQYLPESTALWNNVGMCFFEKKRYVAAISCLKRANYLSPFDWKTLYNLGLVHIRTQQYASAFHFLSAAINLRSDSGAAFMLLGIALSRLGDATNTRQAFAQAAKLSPEQAAVPLNYAVFLHAAGDDVGAGVQLARFERLVENAPPLDQEMQDSANILRTSLTNQITTPSVKTKDHIRGESGVKTEHSQKKPMPASEILSSPLELEQNADEPFEMAPDEV